MKNKKFTFLKTLNVVLLLLITIVGLFGFLKSNQEIKVEAAVKSGYIVLTTSSVEQPSGTNCSQLSKVTSFTYYICETSNLSEKGQLYFKVDGCNSAQCVDGEDSYEPCGPESFSQGVYLCKNKTSKTSAGNKISTLSDNGYSCEVTDNGKSPDGEDLYGMKCQKEGKDIRSDFCVAFRTSEDSSQPLSLSCTPKYMIFTNATLATSTTSGSGDNSFSATIWDVSGGYVFLTDKGSLYLNKDTFGNGVDGVCQPARLLNVVVWFSAVADVTSGNSYSCSGASDLGDFKTQLVTKSGLDKKKDVISRIISNISESSKALVDSLKNCKDTPYAQLTNDKQKADAKKLKADATDTTVFQLCEGGIVAIKNGDKTTAIVGGVTQDYDATTGGIINTTTTAKGTNAIVDAAANLGTFIWQIAAGVLATLLFYINGIVFAVLYFFGAIVLFFLSINPASSDAFQVAAQPWGILVGVANAIILASFMYVGFGYLLGIENLKQNLGEFIQKIIYYALLLNFTLSGAATLVNIGYGMGNLIKVAYAGTTNGQELNYALSGNLLNSIGRVSLIRCGNQGAKDCVIYDNNTGKPDFFKSNNLGGIFGKPESAGEAAIREGISLVMAGFAIYVFWRVLKVVVFRFVGIWLIMILSPIGLASFFSPVESWQTLGKGMWDKFWKFVLFYPAFIFALILVNLLSGTFSAKYTAIDSKVVGADTSATESLLNSTSVILGAVVSMTALYYVTKYFADSFDADMGKVGEAVGKGWEGTKKGFSGAMKVGKAGHRTLTAPVRWVGKPLAKAAFKAVGQEKAFNNLEEFAKTNPLGRTVGDLLTGKTLHSLEARGNAAKRVWEGIQTMNEAEIKGRMAEEEVYASASLRKAGMGKFLDKAKGDPLKNVAKSDLTAKNLNKIAEDKGDDARNSVTEEVALSSSDMKMSLRGMLERGAVDEDRFKDIFNQALKNGDYEVLEILAANKLFLDEARKVAGKGDLDKEAKAKVSSEYGLFLSTEVSRRRNAQGKADKNETLNGINLLDDSYAGDYNKRVQGNADNGDIDAQNLARKVGINDENPGQLSRNQLASRKESKERAESRISEADYEATVNALNDVKGQMYQTTANNLQNLNNDKQDSLKEGLDKIHQMNEGQLAQFTKDHGLDEIHQELKSHEGLKDDVASQKLALKKAVQGIQEAQAQLKTPVAKQAQKEAEVLQKHQAGTATNEDHVQLGIIKGGLDPHLENDFVQVAINEYSASAEIEEDAKAILRRDSSVKGISEAKQKAQKQKQKDLQRSKKKIQEQVRAAHAETDAAEKARLVQSAKDEVSKHIQTNTGAAHAGIDDVVNNNTGGAWSANLAVTGQNEANSGNIVEKIREANEKFGEELRRQVVSTKQINPEDI